MSESRNLTDAIPKKIDEDAMARVTEIAFFRLLIQFVIDLMDFFGPRSSRKLKGGEINTKEKTVQDTGKRNMSLQKEKG